MPTFTTRPSTTTPSKPTSRTSGSDVKPYRTGMYAVAGRAAAGGVGGVGEVKPPIGRMQDYMNGGGGAGGGGGGMRLGSGSAATSKLSSTSTSTSKTRPEVKPPPPRLVSQPMPDDDSDSDFGHDSPSDTDDLPPPSKSKTKPKSDNKARPTLKSGKNSPTDPDEKGFIPLPPRSRSRARLSSGSGSTAARNGNRRHTFDSGGDGDEDMDKPYPKDSYEEPILNGTESLAFRAAKLDSARRDKDKDKGKGKGKGWDLRARVDDWDEGDPDDLKPSKRRRRGDEGEDEDEIRYVGQTRFRPASDSEEEQQEEEEEQEEIEIEESFAPRPTSRRPRDPRRAAANLAAIMGPDYSLRGRGKVLGRGRGRREVRLREDRQAPDPSGNMLLKFLTIDPDPDNPIDPSRLAETETKGRKKKKKDSAVPVKKEREKTVRNGVLQFKKPKKEKEEEEDVDMDLKKEEPIEVDDDITEDEDEEFDIKPTFSQLAASMQNQASGNAVAGPSRGVKLEEEEEVKVKIELTAEEREADTEEETDEEEDIKPVIPLTQNGSSAKPSTSAATTDKKPNLAPSPPRRIVWGDMRGTMGPRASSTGMILEPGESDGEEGEVAGLGSGAAAGVGIGVRQNGKMRMEDYERVARGKDSVRKENDRVAQEEAQKLGMKPKFPCSAARQRKKPYSLDPADDKAVVPIAISRFLRKYQRLGVQFLYDRYKGIKVPGLYEGRRAIKGGILGDDMGLGKTIQVTAFLSAIMHKTGTAQDAERHNLRKNKARAIDGIQDVTPEMLGPTCLIACPSTLVDNWMRELETWAYFEVARVDGQKDAREAVYSKYRKGHLDILIVPHSIIVMDADTLANMFFTVMVVDEAHVLKTALAMRTMAMKNIPARCYFALTGTLIQNRYSEMWSILDFVSPGNFGEKDDWDSVITQPMTIGMSHDATVGELVRKQDASALLRDRILPLIFIRRTKAMVVQELPEKVDQVVFCPLTPIQEMVYIRLISSGEVRQYLRRNEPCPDHPGKKLSQCCEMPDADDPNYKGLVLKYISACQKVASHVGLIWPYKDDTDDHKLANSELMYTCFPPPKLLTEEDEEEDVVMREDSDLTWDPTIDEIYRTMPAEQAAMDKNLSGKWLVLETLLHSWRADRSANNQVLVFSRSVRLLKMLEYWLEDGGFTYQMLHGGCSQQERQEAIDEFQAGKAFVFLISTLAGGVGLNLVKANKVVIFDPSWNPAHDLQAMDRAFRMGQTREVNVYRLISTGTLEENMYERQLNKGAAARTVYEGTIESRMHKGYEGAKDHGDLWGADNMFRYTPGGTITDRVTRLETAEDEVLQKLGDLVGEDKKAGNLDVKNLKFRPTEIEYEDDGAGDDVDVKETDEGLQVEYNEGKDEDRMLQFMGLVPGMRAEKVRDRPKASAAERFIQENASSQYRQNPTLGTKRGYDAFKDDKVVEAVKSKQRKVSGKDKGKDKEEVQAAAPRRAPKLGLSGGAGRDLVD